MTIEDQVNSLVSSVNQIQQAISNITVPAPVVDFTPVTNALTALGTQLTSGLAALQADLDGQLTAIAAQFQPTPAPVAPAPAAS